MTNVLRIKRRALGGSAGAPASLAVGELAFNEVDGGLFIGRSNGSVVQVNSGGGGAAAITIADTPPGSPSPGQMWWESDTGTLFIYFDDGTSQQWVGISGPAAPSVHTHVAADVTDFSETVDDRVAVLLQAGANITLTYNDAAGTLTVGRTSRVLESVVTLTDGATVVLDASAGNVFKLLAAGDRTISVPTNKPAAGQAQRVIIIHEASGANRTLALTTGSAGAFRFGTDVTALTATTSGLIDYVGCLYNAGDDRWDVVSYSKGY